MSLLDRWKRWFLEIYLGDATHPRRHRCRLQPGLHAAEDGMMSMVTVVAVLFLMILLSLVVNVGATVQRKIEIQNAADTVAYSTATWMARGMNAITATNHLIGEMMAFVVLFDALGGPELLLDDPPAYDESSDPDKPIQSLKDIATALKQVPMVNSNVASAYDQIQSNAEGLNLTIKTRGALLKSKLDLVRALTTVYKVKMLAVQLQDLTSKGPPDKRFAPAVALGMAVEALGQMLEAYILAEWNVLNALQTAAHQLRDLPKLIFDSTSNDPGMLANATSYIEQVKTNVESFVSTTKTAAAVGTLNHCSAAVLPAQPQLPLARDWYANTSKSQIVRATYPWVVYHSAPIFVPLRSLHLSRAAQHFNDALNGDDTQEGSILSKCQEFSSTTAHLLYMINDPKRTPPDKDQMSWNGDTQTASQTADQLFCVVGFAHQTFPKLPGGHYLSQPNKDGIVAYAQAMIYNANLYSKSQPSNLQPQLGWDTLNWKPFSDTDNATQNSAFELTDPPSKFKDLTSGNTPPRPQVQVNWQVKLVPVTRLRQDDLGPSLTNLPDPIQRVANRMNSVNAANAKSLKNH